MGDTVNEVIFGGLTKIIEVVAEATSILLYVIFKDTIVVVGDEGIVDDGVVVEIVIVFRFWSREVVVEILNREEFIVKVKFEGCEEEAVTEIAKLTLFG